MQSFGSPSLPAILFSCKSLLCALFALPVLRFGSILLFKLLVRSCGPRKGQPCMTMTEGIRQLQACSYCKNA